SEIAGTVRDMRGAPVPDAVLQVRNEQTMFFRSTRSDESGTYFIDKLPIGNYTIEIVHPGFTKAVFKDVPLFLGTVRTVDVALDGAGVAEQIVITAKLSEVDQSSAALGGRVEQRQLAMVPLNGRNWASLLSLIPGAVDTGVSDQRSVRFAGHGRDDNNFTLD